jgi:Zinc dependent phospholipase C
VPGCAVHFEIATRLLRSWETQEAQSPFPPLDRAARSAFALGSLGPDLGYFPGGDALVADLAHCVRPADLARNVIRAASTAVEKAFAWGWATHVLADIWIHPLINQAVLATFDDSQVRRAGFAHDRAAHIRVETGLDAALPTTAGWADPPRIERGVATSAAELVSRAYQEIYGFSPSPTRLRLTLRWAKSASSLVLLNGAVLSGRPCGFLGRRAIRTVAVLSRTLQPTGLAAAFTNAARPSESLIREVANVIADFPAKFEPYQAVQLANLPNINLDTGQLDSDPPDYPATRAALAELARRRRTIIPDRFAGQDSSF